MTPAAATTVSAGSGVPKVSGRYGKVGSWSRLVVVPIVSNHSCLFAALDLLLFQSRAGVTTLRGLAASAIEADPDTFNDATLEQPREAYIQWIQCPDSWAGYIELVALAQALNIQILVIDISTGRQDVYGDDSLGRRIYLVYHGVHYDAVVGETLTSAGENSILSTTTSEAEVMAVGTGLQPAKAAADCGCAAPTPDGTDTPITIFDPADSEALKQVLALAAGLRARASHGQARRGHG